MTTAATTERGSSLRLSDTARANGLVMLATRVARDGLREHLEVQPLERIVAKVWSMVASSSRPASELRLSPAT